MREDAWLAARLGRAALTVEPDDDPATVAAEARGRAPAMAQAKVPCDDVARVLALQDAGFRVVDVNVTFARAAGHLDAPPGARVDRATPADRDELLDLAGTHFTVSRFHLDPAVPGRAAAAIKRDWVDAYLSGERGERLLVGRDADGEVAGFLAVLDGGDAKIIDLVAVHPDARRTGVGRALVAALAGGRIIVGTQISNTTSLRFYARLGFEIVETRYVLHLHA